MTSEDYDKFSETIRKVKETYSIHELINEKEIEKRYPKFLEMKITPEEIKYYFHQFDSLLSLFEDQVYDNPDNPAAIAVYQQIIELYGLFDDLWIRSLKNQT
ncbi:MAG: hypothetical protein ACOC1O_00010 [bacterium]